MKELYFKPQLKIEEFKTVDIITTSSGEDIDNEPDTDIKVPWS